MIFQLRPTDGVRAIQLKSLQPVLAALSLALLAGCSSKPEQSDVAKALAAVYDCPVLEVRDVKKLDGAPGPQGSYDVAFEYTVAIKGGEAAGIKLMTDWLHLRAERDAVVKAQAVLERQAPKDDARLKALSAYADRINTALNELIPCGGPEIQTVVAPLYNQAKEALQASSGGIVSLPIGVHLSRPGNLGRTEQGWSFNVLAAGFSSFDTLTARPAAISLPPSKVPELLSAGSAPAQEGEQALVGTIHRGATDSCLAVAEAGAEKCYGLPGDAEQAQRIFSVCGDGDRCRITGRVDAKAESFGAVSQVEKVSQ